MKLRYPEKFGPDEGAHVVAVGQASGSSLIATSWLDFQVVVWTLDPALRRLVDQQTVERTRGDYSGAVEAMEFGEVDGQPVMVLGYGDGAAQLWDPLGGRPIGELLPGHNDVVGGMAVEVVDGRPVIAFGDSSGTVCLRGWNQSWTQPWHSELTHPGSVTAVALGRVNNAPVVVSGGSDGKVYLGHAGVRQPFEQPVVSVGVGHVGAVRALAVGVVDEQPVVVSGGDDRTLRVWNADLSENCRIEADAPARSVACTNEGIIVAATTLGLAAFQLP
jgi:WD40 repeat protein